jgi:dynein heavy chain 1
MRTTDDDELETPTSADTSGRPGWMNVLKTHAEEWLEGLPKSLTRPPTEPSPLARFFAREASTGQQLLKRIREDLEELKGVCSGTVKQTNELRALMSDLNKGEPADISADRNLCAGTIPSHWRKYKTSRGTSVGTFITNLKDRLSQLESIAQDPSARRGIWLGGLFQPEAYITATRQAIAHQKGWSLEQLTLRLDVEESTGSESFVVDGEFTAASFTSALTRKV